MGTGRKFVTLRYCGGWLALFASFLFFRWRSLPFPFSMAVSSSCLCGLCSLWGVFVILQHTGGNWRSWRSSFLMCACDTSFFFSQATLFELQSNVKGPTLTTPFSPFPHSPPPPLPPCLMSFFCARKIKKKKKKKTVPLTFRSVISINQCTINQKQFSFVLISRRSTFRAGQYDFFKTYCIILSHPPSSLSLSLSPSLSLSSSICVLVCFCVLSFVLIAGQSPSHFATFFINDSVCFSRYPFLCARCW